MTTEDRTATLVKGLSDEAIQEVGRKLMAIDASRKDYVVPASKIAMFQSNAEGAGPPTLTVRGLGDSTYPTSFGVRKIAHEQIADKLGIPLPYYRRMLADEPRLLATNVNTWLDGSGKKYLVRTLDGDVRALLGDSYRIRDDFDVFFHGVKAITKAGAPILQAVTTEEKLYVKAIHPDFRARITTMRERVVTGGHNFNTDGFEGGQADLVCPGVVIRNSPVGRGGTSVAPFVFRFVCSNGAAMDNELFAIHSGRKQEEGLYITDETRRLEDEAFYSRMGDLIAATFDEDKWRNLVATMNGMASAELDAPIEAVANISKAYGLTEEAQDAILQEMMRPSTPVNPGLTQWGLMNAITFLGTKADEAGDHDAAFEYQKIGGDFLQQTEKVRELVRVR